MEDLNKILVPLWSMQKYENLVNILHKSQNEIDKAINEKSKNKRDNFIRDCRRDLDAFRLAVEDKLEEERI